MKKTLLAVLIFGKLTNLLAQPGLYFNVSGGYGWPALQQTQQAITFQPNGTDPAQSIIVPMINERISDSSSNRYKKNLYTGYTNGGNINLLCGYMINPYVGFEVVFSALIGNKLHAESVQDFETLGANTSIKTTTWSYGLNMSPSIRFHACKPDAKVVPFGRFGIAIPFWGATMHELNITAPNFTGSGRLGTAYVKAKTESAFSLGFNGSIGVGYNITKWLRVYGEVNGQYLNVRSKKTTLEAYNIYTTDPSANFLLKAIYGSDFDGDVLASPNITTFSKETEFVDELNENSNTTIFGKQRKATALPDDKTVDEDKPRQELRRTANFSAFGFTFGLAFTINNTAWKKKKDKQPVPVHP